MKRPFGVMKAAPEDPSATPLVVPLITESVPAIRSYNITSLPSFVSSSTRSFASDSKTTNLPSAEILAANECPLPAALLVFWLTSVVSPVAKFLRKTFKTNSRA
jgi:hypothetical protein